MGIKGRRRYVVYLKEDCVDKLREFLKLVDTEENVTGGLSGFLNDQCCSLVAELENADDDALEGFLEQFLEQYR